MTGYIPRKLHTLMVLIVVHYFVCTEGIIDALGPTRRLQLLKLFNLEIKAKKFESRAVVSEICCLQIIVPVIL